MAAAQTPAAESAALTLPAPAKLNLWLHICGRRGDGYHNLQTLFQLLDWGDQLTFTANNRGVVELLGSPPGVAIEQNLIVRAAEQLRPFAADHAGCTIALDKVVPMGGGLGGGSSDAATTLVALNALWQCQLSSAQLCALGAQLGADVPLFVAGHSAFAEGIGEQLSAVQIEPRWYLLVTPNCHVDTGEIFSHPQLTRESPAIKIRALSTALGRNDCEAVVEQLYPEVAAARNWLSSYSPALMTGTGASVFAAFCDRNAAEQVAAQVPQKWRAFVAQGVNESPLHSAMRNNKLLGCRQEA